MNLVAVFFMVYALWRFTRPERRHPFPRWKKGEYWGIGQGGVGKFEQQPTGLKDARVLPEGGPGEPEGVVSRDLHELLA